MDRAGGQLRCARFVSARTPLWGRPVFFTVLLLLLLCRVDDGNKPCNSIKDRLIINGVVAAIRARATDKHCTCSKANIKKKKKRSRRRRRSPELTVTTRHFVRRTRCSKSTPQASKGKTKQKKKELVTELFVDRFFFFFYLYKTFYF